MERKIQRCLVLPSAMLLFGFTEVSCANKGRVRNSYASKEECQRDNPASDDCEEDSKKSTISGGHAAYWGPWYNASANRPFSNHASGVVNDAGDYMPASQAKAASPSAFANFSTSGTGSTVKATGTSYSRGGFGATSRASSSSFGGGSSGG